MKTLLSNLITGAMVAMMVTLYFINQENKAFKDGRIVMSQTQAQPYDAAAVFGE